MGREKGSPRNALVDSPSVWMGSDVTEHLGVTAWFVCFSVAPARAGTRVCEHKTVYRNDARSAQDPQPVRATHTQECSPPKKSVSEESLSIITATEVRKDDRRLSRSDRSHTHRRCRHCAFTATALPQHVSNQPDSTRVCADTVSSHR